MAMTKEKAKQLLSDYLKKNDLPIVDAVVYNKTSFDIPQSINKTYTFVGLLCIAYDLKKKEE